MENTENKNINKKSIEKITNEELFQEFKRRGFFTIPNEPYSDIELKYIVVSVQEPDNRIFVDYRKHWGGDGLTHTNEKLAE